MTQPRDPGILGSLEAALRGAVPTGFAVLALTFGAPADAQEGPVARAARIRVFPEGDDGTIVMRVETVAGRLLDPRTVDLSGVPLDLREMPAGAGIRPGDVRVLGVDDPVAALAVAERVLDSEGKRALRREPGGGRRRRGAAGVEQGSNPAAARAAGEVQRAVEDLVVAPAEGAADAVRDAASRVRRAVGGIVPQ